MHSPVPVCVCVHVCMCVCVSCARAYVRAFSVTCCALLRAVVGQEKREEEELAVEKAQMKNRYHEQYDLVGNENDNDGGDAARQAPGAGNGGGGQGAGGGGSGGGCGDADFVIRVEAVGSGNVLIPRLVVGPHTTLGDVRRQVEATNAFDAGTRLQLFAGHGSTTTLRIDEMHVVDIVGLERGGTVAAAAAPNKILSLIHI